jgi:hypothetical protein
VQPGEGHAREVNIEGEMRQFDRQFKIEKRFVEQIVTGEFIPVNKDVDIEQRAPVNVSAPTKKFDGDFLLRQAQQQWVARLYSMFTLVLGLLAGMSFLHLLFIFGIPDADKFKMMYCGFAKTLNIFFLFFANLVVILSYALALIYK